MNLKNRLLNSVKDTLSMLGGGPMNAIMWELKRKRISFDPDTFDIQQFERAIRQIFGHGTDVIMEEICLHFCKQSRIDIKFEPDLSALEKIKKILELGK